METGMTCNLPEQPLISVIMPVYDAEPYLKEAIASILAQTYPRFEFIIVDDGSTDGSADIVRAFAERDSRIRPLFLPHGGLARALNAGIELVHGDLIARMDADDVSLPERLSAQLDWMRQTGVDVCGSYWKAFGDQEYIGWVPESHIAICYELVLGVALLHPTVMLRADIAREHSYDGTLLTTSDSELWTRLAPLYRLGNVPCVLLKYRVHARQNHVLMHSVMVETLRKWRRRLLQSLFPQISEADCALLDRVAEKEPFADLTDLERAGTWLVRLAQTPDAYLRQRMANRWRAACRRSVRLGLGCYHLYRKIVPEFGAASRNDFPSLRLACTLRLQPESRFGAAFRWLNIRLAPFFRRGNRSTNI
jgi:glycosyltransferase involved in cell wall biosynthesis